MFVRFRQTPRRLQASIVETRRKAGKVASLGTIGLPMTVRGRQAFWAYLWDRLATLSNRVGSGMTASGVTNHASASRGRLPKRGVGQLKLASWPTRRRTKRK
jgi:hypothetical protein